MDKSLKTEVFAKFVQYLGVRRCQPRFRSVLESARRALHGPLASRRETPRRDNPARPDRRVPVRPVPSGRRVDAALARRRSRQPDAQGVRHPPRADSESPPSRPQGRADERGLGRLLRVRGQPDAEHHGTPASPGGRLAPAGVHLDHPAAGLPLHRPPCRAGPWRTVGARHAARGQRHPGTRGRASGRRAGHLRQELEALAVGLGGRGRPRGGPVGRNNPRQRPGRSNGTGSAPLHRRFTPGHAAGLGRLGLPRSPPPRLHRPGRRVGGRTPVGPDAR